MTTSMALDCPHCGTEGAGFTSLAEYSRQPDQEVWYLFLRCNICQGPVVAALGGYVRNSNARTSPHNCPSDPRQHDYREAAVWPADQKQAAPEHLPEPVERAYLQGLDNLRRENWDAAGIMFRKAVDVGTRQIDPTLTGKLDKRIDKLAAAYAITPAMRDWAHEVRLGGNEAAHEDEPFTEDEAIELQSFTQLFLMYAFTLPKMVADRKNKPGEKSTG